ncbi:MAG: radical SAM protein [Candidatus Latescibacteria bacterium]|nr:radical SAM protein [bacterium]MBD3424579.1 radical SAM protein [Candidatus Latescibacterota bacterium]
MPAGEVRAETSPALFLPSPNGSVLNGNEREKSFVNWFITEKCNFSCEYCSIVNPRGFRKALHRFKRVVKSPSPRKFDIYEELDDILARFEESGMRFTFGFTGGEPFVYPRFREICARIIQHDDFMIALDTNLAIGDMDRFIETVPPEKVEYIFASTHILERERVGGGLDSFLDRVRLLEESGYSVDVNYVMYPPLFDRVNDDYQRCLDRGVRLSIKPFKGVFEGKKYPGSYTGAERDIIRSLRHDSAGEEIGPRSWFGMYCGAGRNLIRVLSNGDVVRCAGDFNLLGNIFTGFRLYESPRPCIAGVCPCYSPEQLVDGRQPAEKFLAIELFNSRLRGRINRLREWWHQQ